MNRAFEPKPLRPRPASLSARDAPPRLPFRLRATPRRASVPRQTARTARCAPTRRREGAGAASPAWPLDTIGASARDGCAQRTRGDDATPSRPRLTRGTPAPPAQSPAVTDLLLQANWKTEIELP